MKDIIRMQQLAGIITEDQAKKMIEVLNENKSTKKQSVKENTLGIDADLKNYWPEWAAKEVEIGNDSVINAGGVNANLDDVPYEVMNMFREYVNAVETLQATSEELRDDIAAAVSGILFNSGKYEDYKFDVLTKNQFYKIKYEIRG